jgi:hypothetical protein
VQQGDGHDCREDTERKLPDEHRTQPCTALVVVHSNPRSSRHGRGIRWRWRWRYLHWRRSGRGIRWRWRYLHRRRRGHRIRWRWRYLHRRRRGHRIRWAHLYRERMEGDQFLRALGFSRFGSYRLPFGGFSR